MFLQNLKKKLSKAFEDISNLIHETDFKNFLETNFFNILKVIIMIGLFIISLIIVIFLININKYKKPVNKTENIVIEKKEPLVDKNFILENEFLYPEITFFDITVDYKEFMPLKRRNLPEFNEVINDYEYIFKDSIDQSLKFNFEKRRGK
ncbi:MAG TPA: hypothetical protein PLE45_11090 [Spirochaetota bacterium]|nr:hypothetical protein [Spirochaetota bacterium]HOL57886.1 hypothetical protein [Spirochaetota bacterium]HPP05440.1 hypothetical protein [Spirochaetota bacterium]